jgi:hypothetical protein
MSTCSRSGRGGRRAHQGVVYFTLENQLTMSPKTMDLSILAPRGGRAQTEPAVAFYPAIQVGQSSAYHPPRYTRQALPPNPIRPFSTDTSKADLLFFPRQLPINSSLSRWCKWRLHQRSPTAQWRCGVHSLPGANVGRAHPGLQSGMDGRDGIYSGGMGRGLLFFCGGSVTRDEYLMFGPTARSMMAAASGFDGAS